jgi:hypothetical protein
LNCLDCPYLSFSSSAPMVGLDSVDAVRVGLGAAASVGFSLSLSFSLSFRFKIPNRFFFDFSPFAAASVLISDGGAAEPLADVVLVVLVMVLDSSKDGGGETPNVLITIVHSSLSFCSCSGVRFPGRPGAWSEGMSKGGVRAMKSGHGGKRRSAEEASVADGWNSLRRACEFRASE